MVCKIKPLYAPDYTGPVHPGAVLLEEYMRPLDMNATELAKAIGICTSYIGIILNGRCAISVNTAIRLSQYFGTTAEYWLELQLDYDLAVAEALQGKMIRAGITPRKV